MNEPNYQWKPLATHLPSEREFDPFRDDLDAQSAWKEFGGKSLNEAYKHFMENPLNHQEDFMWMGSVAFRYYFPVIERYLYMDATSEFDDVAAILAKDIEFQFKDSSLHQEPELLARVSLLTDYVLTHLAQYSISTNDQESISKAWRELRDIVHIPPA